MNTNLANTDAVTSSLLIDSQANGLTRKPRGLVQHWWVPFSASSIFVVSGHLLIKAGLSAAALSTGSGSLLTRVLHSALQPEVAGGLLVYLMGSMCWMLAVAQQEISFLYPLSSINYVLVVFASSTFFHESLSPRRLSGVALIVLGMVLMNRKSGGAR